MTEKREEFLKEIKVEIQEKPQEIISNHLKEIDANIKSPENDSKIHSVLLMSRDMKRQRREEEQK